MTATLGFVPITVGPRTGRRPGCRWHKPDCSKLTGGDVFQLPVCTCPHASGCTPGGGERPLEVVKTPSELQHSKSPPPAILGDLIFLYHLSKRGLQFAARVNFNYFYFLI